MTRLRAWLNPRRRVLAAILVAGLGASAVIFATATEPAEDAQVAEMLQSKGYRRQLELVGGKASLLAADLDDWFTGLWQGRALAGTVAVLTVAVALAYRAWPRAPGPPGGAAAG